MSDDQECVIVGVVSPDSPSVLKPYKQTTKQNGESSSSKKKNRCLRSSTADVDEEEVVFVRTKPPDDDVTQYPHSREDCTQFPFCDDRMKYCPNCYCFVCDTTASTCKQWADHCQATRENPLWCAKRADLRKQRKRKCQR